MISPGAVRRSAGGGRSAAWPGTAGAGLVPAAIAAALGCGGGAPLLHPAQPLPADTVSFGAGVSAQFASGAVEAAIDRGRVAAAGPLAEPATARAYAAGVLTEALVAPGISPWVAARVGLPASTEAGLTYTGRSLRLDGRHVLRWSEEWALSLGLGASALILQPDSSRFDGEGEAAPGAGTAEFGLDASGFGADLPVLVGYQPVDGFVDVWLGLRAGYERVDGELRSRADDETAPRFDAEASRFWAGALAGFSLGLPPLWLRFELAGTFHDMSGRLTSPGAGEQPAFGELDATGWSVSPSGALLGKF